MHRIRKVLALTLTCAFLLGLSAPAFAVTSKDLEAHRDAAAEARKKAADADKRAAALTSEIDQLEAEIEQLAKLAASLAPKIELAAKKTSRLEKEIAKLRAECASTQADIEQTQAEYERQQELLAERVVSSYKQGGYFYLEMLFSADDMTDLIARTELVSRVIDSNNKAAASLGYTKSKLESTKEKLDRDLDKVKLKAKEAKAVENQLKDLRAQRRSAANASAAAQDQKETLLADTKANAKRLRALAEAEEAESDRIAAMLSGSGSGEFSGSMAWPVPASRRITSNFGWRICPFHGKEMHPGIDVGASSGSSIVAAADGKVIYAGYRGGYGNTIIIDHGNGVTSLYAHQQAGGLKVSSGETVTKGQRIGTVGSTGYSTGPHLHFEVRVNGTPKNPLSYTG